VVNSSCYFTEPKMDSYLYVISYGLECTKAYVCLILTPLLHKAQHLTAAQTSTRVAGAVRRAIVAAGLRFRTKEMDIDKVQLLWWFITSREPSD
jgi:hypothetical protein